MGFRKYEIVLFFVALITLGTTCVKAQHVIDSTKIEALEEVIVTGQINPQSVKQSVFEVKVIGRQDIEFRAGNNLADLLNQSLNINIIPELSSGKSGVGLFGLDAQYFKVLIDNIPVINEEGFGNNVDLTLINLDDVQRIEIVEGSMGAQYGANAVSGIINIVTKKKFQNSTKIAIYSQEETVGNEYGFLDKGRHIQSVSISHNLSKTISGSANYFRNDFAGFWNDKKGKIHAFKDGLRGHEWLPKEQHNGKATLRYASENGFKAFYKYDYLSEYIPKYSSQVKMNENVATGKNNPSSVDEIYRNNRHMHHLNASGSIGQQLTYDVSLSSQKQNKYLERYVYFIRSGIKENVYKTEFLTRSVIFSRGTLNNLFKSELVTAQVGYEVNDMKGKGSPLSSQLGFEDNKMVSQRLYNYDVFATSELQATTLWALQPSFRISLSNLFNPQYMLSLSSKYNFKNDLELRTVLGSSNRTPSYSELYTYFVDINHNVQGNPNLNPEQGYSIFTHLKKDYALKKGKLSSKLSASYINVKDRIEMIIVNTLPLAYQYNNINTFRSVGVFFENSYQRKRLKGQVGFSLQGISKLLNSESDSRDDFLYNIQFNTNITYTIPKWNSAATLYFKHIGKQPQFVLKANDEGNYTFQRGVTNPISWLDATFKTDFAKKAIEATFGVRNILNVRNVNTTAFSGGAHNGPPSEIPMAYGKSFFLKLKYQINI